MAWYLTSSSLLPGREDEDENRKLDEEKEREKALASLLVSLEVWDVIAWPQPMTGGHDVWHSCEKRNIKGIP